MVRLVGVCQHTDDKDAYKRHQLPIFVEDMRTMIVQFDEPCQSVSADGCGTSYQQFCEKIKSFSFEELRETLTMDIEQFNVMLAQVVPCVGCRRSVEKLFADMATLTHVALDPMVVNTRCEISVQCALLRDTKRLYDLLVLHGNRSKTELENLTKCRKNKRCALHSLDTHVYKNREGWDAVWELMTRECQEECCIVDVDSLQDMLETYLQKHRFCNECRTKVQKAYGLLVGEVATDTEKHYNASLYQGLRYCQKEQHLHVEPSLQYLNMLALRAEPELFGSIRERHAKTIDIAQGEVLTCLGVYLYDRLHRILTAMRTLQQTFEILYCTAVITLHNNFQLSWETKHGISASLDVICAELQNSAANNNNNVGKQAKTKKRSQRKKTSKANSTGLPERCQTEMDHGSSCDKECETCNVCSRRQGFYTPSPTRTSGPGSSLSPGAKRKVSRSLSPCPQPHVNGLHSTSSSPSRSGISCASSLSSESREPAVTTVVPLKSASNNDLGYCSQELSPGERCSVRAVATVSCACECETKPLAVKPQRLQLQGLLESTTSEDDTSSVEADNVSVISAEEIAWFSKHHSNVSQERLALRERLKQQFSAMQARLLASLPAQVE